MVPNWKDLFADLFAMFNFAMPDWKDLLDKLPPFPQDPRIAAIMSKITSIITLIMTPLKILIGLIKKLMDLITHFITIPLNPTDIPEWTKGIMEKFTKLIEMLIGLPTLDGIMDLLFMSTDGLMLVDLFVPGFAEFFGMFMDMLDKKQEVALKLDEELKDKKKELSKKLKIKSDKINQLKSKISTNKSLLLNKENDLINEIKSKIKIIDANQETLKNLISDIVSKDSLNDLEIEMENNCDRIDILKERLKNISISKKTKEQLQNEIDMWEDELSKIDDVHNTDDLETEIGEKESKSSDLKKQSLELGSICEWGNNMDSIIEQLKEMVLEMINDTNPFEPLIKVIDDKIVLLEKELDNLGKREDFVELVKAGENGKIDTTNEDKKIKKIQDKLKKQIEDLDIGICDVGISDSEASKRMVEIDDMKKLLVEKEEEKQNKLDLFDIDLILEQKKKLQEIIDKVKEEKNDLVEKLEQFKKEIELKLASLNDIVKHLPVIFNIICSAPKVVVNIFVGLLNAVGAMKFLPNLWEFPYV